MTLVDLSIGMQRERLDAAVAWAEAAYANCDVCAQRCHVDRTAGPAGVCHLGVDARIYKEYLHLGEEAALVPSHTVFTTGCNFRCVFCSDDRFVRRPQEFGVVIPPEALAHRIAQRRAQGATNVNFVGGVPDVNVLFILRTLQHCPDDTHVVWNTNLWTTPEAMDHLDGVVGTWLADYKFGNDRCARKLAGGIRDYMGTLDPLLDKAVASRANVIVRHLVMPGHVACCTLPVIDRMAQRWPDTPLNLMLGYHPFQLAGRAGALGGMLPDDERLQAVAYARDAGIPLLEDGVAVRPAAAAR